MKRVRILQSYYQTNEYGMADELFKGGELYELNAKTQRQIELRNAELVENDEPAERNAAETGGRSRVRFKATDA